MNGERSVKNDASGNHPAEDDVGSEDSEQTRQDDGSANKHPQKLSTSKPSRQRWRVSARDDKVCELAAYREIRGLCNALKYCSETPRWLIGLQSKGTAWEDRLSELADHPKIHEHYNVPYNYNDSHKLATWVVKQRSQYRLQKERKTSPMTPSRNQALESLGFEWKPNICRWQGTRKNRVSTLTRRVFKRGLSSH
jgi:hypothetical protein